MSEPARLRAADTDRDQTLALLQQAHAEGRLDLDELDERQSAVLQARYLDELAPMVADLPASAHLPMPRPGKSPATRSSPGSAVLPTSEPVVSGMSIMSGSHVQPGPGVQQVGRFVLWGGDSINLCDCMGPGVRVEVRLVAVMGGCQVQVPPGVRIIDQTVNIMAGNSLSDEALGDGSNGTVVLRGFSWWAGHSVVLDKRFRP